MMYVNDLAQQHESTRAHNERLAVSPPESHVFVEERRHAVTEIYTYTKCIYRVLFYC